MSAEPSPSEVDYSDRRALPRLPTTLRAKVFPGEYDCVIKDYNERGARLSFTGRAPTEDNLVVVVWSTGLAFEAVTRWRSPTEVGVRFIRSCDFRGRAPSHLLDIKALWTRSRTRNPRRALMSQTAMLVRRKGA